MAGDLFGLSAADRDVLLRMIARERANYSANVRSLAPVPREKNIWKPSSPIQWFWLKAPLYPQSDYSPYNDEVWQTTGCAMQWNSETKQWDSVYPETEEIIYSTANMYAMTDMVIPCQKRDDGWEPVAPCPPDNVVLKMRPQTSGDITSTLSGTGVRFEETTKTPSDNEGFLRFQKTYSRFAYPGSSFQRAIDIGTASPSLNFETDGEIEVNYTAVYDITFSAEISCTLLADSPPGRGSVTNTSGASAGTAHTHTYYSVQNGYNLPIKFRPKMWRRPVGGSYAEETALSWIMPEASLNPVGTGSQSMSYFGRIAQLLEEGDTLGMKAFTEQLAEARLEIRYFHLGFHILQPGHAS